MQDAHLKSLLDVVLESSQKRLIALRTKLKDDPAKLAECERRFMLTECAKLESLAICRHGWLPKKHADAKGTIMGDAVGHSYIHTNDYAKWVGRSLGSARNKAGMINRLRDLRMKLQSGKGRKDVVALLTEKGKADLSHALKGGTV